MKPSDKNAKYWPGLDGLRTFAFFAVLAHHCKAVPDFHRPRELAMLVQGWIQNGWISIDCFFVISGFLMASLLIGEGAKYGKISLRLFYTRRILRIWPPFYLSIFTALFVLPFFEYREWTVQAYTQFLKSIVPIFCFLGNFWGPDLTHLGNSSKLIWPLWSLCVEEQFYLFLPISLILVRSFKLRVFLYSFALLSSVTLRAIFITHGGGHGMWYLNTFSHMDPLWVGVLLGLCNQRFNLFDRLRKHPRFGFGIFAASLAVVVAILRFAPPVQENGTIWISGVLVSSLAFAGLVIAGCSFTPFENFLGIKPIADFGKKTYSMYLWHFYVLVCIIDLQAWLGMPETPMNWTIRYFVSLVFVYGIACFLWKYMEAPILKFKDKFQPGRPKPAPIAVSEPTADRVLVGAAKD